MVSSRVEQGLPPALSASGHPKLEAQVLLPSDSGYGASESSYWSKTARIGPACIVRPSSVAQVSEALKALVKGRQPFAVRSGGHAPLAGVNNIPNGVTVDLTLLNSLEYDATSETVSFGPGVRWNEVFAKLQPHHRIVAGGREGQTGVGGFLLGGGNSWIAAREGLACDTVIAFEVVLGSGDVVIARREGEHADLFRALKGGWNNFGIVTKFTMRTFPNDYIWGGVMVSPKENTATIIEATERFTKAVPAYPDSSLIVVIGHVEALGDTVVTLAVVETRGVEDSPAWADFNSLPTIMDTRARKTMLDMGVETGFPSDPYSTWSTLTTKNDQRIMLKASELHDELVRQLLAYVPEGDFTTQLIFQPLPTLFAEHSVAAGGNVLGLERNKHDGIIVQFNTMMKTSDQERYAEPRVRAALEALRDFASTIEGGLFEWVYVNYADSSQDVIQGYGEENVKFMQSVAAKYDPDRVFQDLCKGGFKVSRAY